MPPQGSVTFLFDLDSKQEKKSIEKRFIALPEICIEEEEKSMYT